MKPHVNTHKFPAIAGRQLESGAAGITVVEVFEAEVIADGDVLDIVIAYPLVMECRPRLVYHLLITDKWRLKTTRGE